MLRWDFFWGGGSFRRHLRLGLPSRGADFIAPSPELRQVGDFPYSRDAEKGRINVTFEF